MFIMGVSKSLFRQDVEFEGTLYLLSLINVVEDGPASQHIMNIVYNNVVQNSAIFIANNHKGT